MEREKQKVVEKYNYSSRDIERIEAFLEFLKEELIDTENICKI